MTGHRYALVGRRVCCVFCGARAPGRAGEIDGHYRAAGFARTGAAFFRDLIKRLPGKRTLCPARN